MNIEQARKVLRSSHDNAAIEEAQHVVTQYWRGVIHRAEQDGRDLTGEEDKTYHDDMFLHRKADLNKLNMNGLSRTDIAGGTAIDLNHGYRFEDEDASPIIRSGQSVVPFFRSKGLLEHNTAERGLSFGGFCRAMVLGARTDAERRALSEGSDSAGGYTVPTNLLAQLIDNMRNRTVVMRAGAVTVPLTTEKTHLARLASDPQAAWRSENGSVAESDPTFERIEFTARSLAVLVKVSRELLEDSLNIEASLINAFAQSMAVELDRVALMGSGVAPEPAGIANTSNVGDLDAGGAALTNYDEFIDCIQWLEEQNAAAPTAAVMAPRTKAALAKLKDLENRPLVLPPSLSELPFYSTNQIPINEESGTTDNGSRIIIGDFTQLFVGVRTQLQVNVLRERFADTHQYGFVAHLRADVQLAHPESFAMITDIEP